MRFSFRHLIVVLSLLASGCAKKSEVSTATSYEGHSLGENSMMWSAAENQLQSDPLEVCKEMVQSGANSASDEGNKCRKFLVTGDYRIDLNDWQSGKKRIFKFTAWKLSAMIFEFSEDQTDRVRQGLIQHFGAPVGKDQWRGTDGAFILAANSEETKTVTVVFLAR